MTFQRKIAATLVFATVLPATGAAAQNAEESEIAEDEGLNVIVVTAQKRSQDLQDVPAAISAFSSDDLTARGISETSDLMGSLPNLQISSASGDTQPNFSLRGISVANEFSASTASPVGVYVDEVYQNFRANHGQQLYDLERVEVLRGPQGTLYGRNTTGGAINFITRRPDLYGTNGYVTAGFSNYNTLKLEGALELTLAEDVAGVRAAFTRTKGDGFTFNPTLNEDFASSDSYAGRLTFRFKPSDDLDITLKGYFAENNPRQDIAYGIGYLEGRTNAAGYSRFDPRPELGGRLLAQNEVQADTAGDAFTAARGLSLTVEAQLSDALTLTSITGYDEGEYRLSPFDCDGSPVDICAIRYDSDSVNFNQDLRLSYQADRLNVIAGVYYGRDSIDTQNEPDFFGFLRPVLLGAGVPGEFGNVPIAIGNSLQTLPAFALDPTLQVSDPGFCAPVVVNPNGYFDARSLVAFNADVATTNTATGTAFQAACAAAGAPPFAPILADQRFTLTRPSAAIYGEATYELTNDLSITLGLRYTWDDVKYEDASSVIFDLAGTNPTASLVPYSLPFDPNFQQVNQKESSGELTGRVVIDYSFAEDILGYASYSRGYRSGTYNGLAYQDIGQVYFVEPESVNAYEIGVKSRLLNNNVQLNVAGFYYDYSNQQIAQVIGATSFLRAADGRSFGAEAELAVQASNSVRIDASLGYLNTKYTGNVIDPTDPASLTLNINGNRFANAPEWTGSLGAEFTPIDTGVHRLQLRGDMQYIGKFFFDPFGSYGQDPCDQPAAGSLVLQATPELACGNPDYVLVNARATYTYDDAISVSVWGKNLTDKFYYAYGLNLNAFFQDYLTRGAPQTYGIEVSYRF